MIAILASAFLCVLSLFFLCALCVEDFELDL
jgi:hypothetical protein